MHITDNHTKSHSGVSVALKEKSRAGEGDHSVVTVPRQKRHRSNGLSMVTSNILDLIGNTPLLHLKGERVFAKAEFLNPGGSIKDRVAFAMLEVARREGKLNGQTIICEPTSGNTGIGLALVGRIMGYRVRIVMPEGMSEERKKLIRTLGADLVLIPDEEGLTGAICHVREMAAEDRRIFVPQQFENPANPRVHYEHTARELWGQMRGEIDCFVAGVGSGGTLQGVGKFLKEQNKEIRIVAVEPENCSALMGHEPGLHQIQGIGDGFIPDVLDTSLVDEVIQVSDAAAIETTRQLSRDLGLLVGISSGANVWAARQLTREITGNITTVLPDRAERYFSTSLM
ncbi:MAG: cysteine synthase A [Sedimentisphaerales bacterium]